MADMENFYDDLIIINLYYDTSGRLVFVHFLEEFEDSKTTFRN